MAVRAISLCSILLFCSAFLAACGETAAVSAADAAADAPFEVKADGAVVDFDLLPTDIAADSTELACPGAKGCECSLDADCDDQNPCTTLQVCAKSQCTAGAPALCDDGDPCTVDSCALPDGCTAVVVNDMGCSDGDNCTVGEKCTDGKCMGGKAKNCDDGNLCTDDSCTKKFGCTAAHNKLKCADGNSCIEISYCAFGGCQQGKFKGCDDGEICTYEFCDPVKGCEFINLPEPLTACDGEMIYGRCVKAFAKTNHWEEARQNCIAWGGDLISVRNKQENQKLLEMAQKTCAKDASIWIGYTDAAQEGNFRWSDGTHGKYWGFGGGEPNNSGDEDYVQLTPNGFWNDIGGGAQMPCSICGRKQVNACDDDKGCASGDTCGGGKCNKIKGKPLSCDDFNPCTLDGCAVGLGCGHTATADGEICSDAGTCTGGGCIMAKPQGNLPKSCAEILAGKPLAVNGAYWLDANGEGYQGFCDMQAGGWTLALKVDGKDPKSGFAASIWTDAAPFNVADFMLNDKQAKLASFSTLSFKELRVGMRKDGQTNWLVIKASAPVANLLSLFVGDKPLSTGQGVFAWESLLEGASLQSNCLQEGINQVAGGAKVRLGIFGNNENDCSSVDSWLGLGGTDNCGSKGTPTSGNIACYGPDHGETSVAVMGYLMVR